jgi:hypothetical protein
MIGEPKPKIMKSIELKKKYPTLWNNIYKDMVYDLCQCMPRADVQQYEEHNPDCRIVRIAHNAAFMACDRIHKFLMTGELI